MIFDHLKFFDIRVLFENKHEKLCNKSFLVYSM